MGGSDIPSCFERSRCHTAILEESTTKITHPCCQSIACPRKRATLEPMQRQNDTDPTKSGQNETAFGSGERVVERHRTWVFEIISAIMASIRIEEYLKIWGNCGQYSKNPASLEKSGNVV